MVTGIWWRNLAYFLAGFAVLGVLGFAVLFVPNLVYLVARFGVLAGVLGVLGFSVLFVARFGVYLVDVLWCALVAEFGVLGG